MSGALVLDLLLRGAALVMLLAVAVLLATALQRRGALRAIGVALALSIAAFVLTSSGSIVRLIAPLDLPLSALCVAKPVLFWLFVRGLFDDGLQLRRVDLVALAAAVAAGLWHEWLYRPAVWVGAADSAEHAAAALYLAAIATCVGAALLRVWRERAADLVERRRRLRAGFVAVAGLYMVMVAVVQLTLLWGAGGTTPRALVTLNLVAIALAALLACVGLLRRRPLDDLFDGAPSQPAALATDPALDRLRAHLAREREWFRQPGLTVRGFAEQLGLHEYQLRRAINQGLGQRNFNHFVNAHRIAWACERLRAEPARQVLVIALDAGFASLGPFNREFKARIGTTPTAFRRAQGWPIPQSAAVAPESAGPQAMP